MKKNIVFSVFSMSYVHFVSIVVFLALFIIWTKPISAQTAFCTSKINGDADCNVSIDLADYQIWRTEYLAGCSSANISVCAPDDDGNGFFMDANFDYPGSGVPISDEVVTIADYQIWRTGYFGGTTNPPTPTPTDILNNPTSTPTPIRTTTPPPAGSGIWISQEEINTLPTSGQAWSDLQSAANESLGSSALWNQDSKHPQRVLAAALVAAKQGSSATCGGQNCRAKAAAGIADIMNDTFSTGGGDGRVLALGRNLAAYVIAAEIMNLQSYDASLDSQFRSFLQNVKSRTDHSGACASLIECHGKRPNNWGTMAGASRIAADIYLGDQADLNSAINVYKGFIGDTSAYNSFSFDSAASQYACSPQTPMNPPNCTISPPGCGNGITYDFSGAVIDDVRRELSGSPTCPPDTNYAWGGYSGVLAQAEMLHRAGHDSYGWQSEAIKRGMAFLENVMPGSISGATEWVPWVVNHHYGTSFNAPNSLGWGRLVHFTNWTHSQ